MESFFFERGQGKGVWRLLIPVRDSRCPLLSDLCSRHEKDSLVGHYRYLPLQARYLLALISGLSSNIVGSVNLSLVGLFSFGCEE